MTPNKTLQLNLTNPQTQNLLQLQQQLNEKLEQWGSLRPEMLADLTEEMKKILQGQAEYPNIAAQTRNRQSRLHLTHNDPNILNLPWRLATQDLRLLYLTKGKNTSEDLPILEADNPPLKILVMISSPENASYESRLNYEEEEDQIIQAFENLFDSGGVQIDFTDDGSLDNLAGKIAANRYHIVHFSGHGVYHKEKKKSYLALEDSLTMHQELVEAEKFAEVFQRKPQNMPALIVLSSCQTAKGGTEQGMKSVTDELLLKGLPAVISMSVSVTDYFATYFAGVLYQQLAQKEPLFRAFQSAIGATRQHEQKRLPNRPPSQWMIPQLFVSQQVEQPVDFSKAAQNLHYSAWKFVSGKEGLQTQKRNNYQFVGRRRDRKRIFQSWAKRPAILLKGQGGVGKTAMAEYVLQRLVAKNPQFHAFIFNEYTANMSNIIAKLEKYLKTHKLRKLVLALQEKYEDNAYKHFEALFAEVEEHCQPLFIFDNLESFQSAPRAAFRTELADSLTKIINFCYTEDIPLILTCRYSVAECPDIPTFDLNQVARNDFLKKALQMSLQALPRKIRQQGLAHLLNEQKLTFREVIIWLHETFGGNYRALEFFDEVFAQKKNKLPQALKTLADFKQQYADAEIETRQLMSKNLLFEELLKLLEEDEKTALRLLSKFRIPVLVTALQMQKHDLDYPSILDSLQELTLLEQHRDVEQPVLQYFYVTPLVKDLVKGAFEKEEEVDFSVEMAGRYHKWIFDDIKKLYVADLEEAFDFFVEVKNGGQLNEIGEILCDFYYNSSQFQSTLQLGLEVYQINKKETDWEVLNKIGLVYHIFGKGIKSLFFWEICEQKANKGNNLENKGAIWNNMGQIYNARGEYEMALKYLEKSLAISQQIADKRQEGTTLSNISQIFKARGEYEMALKYLEQSLVISQQIADKKIEGRTLNFISQIHSVRGDYETALKYFKQSLTISQQIGDKQGEGGTLNNMSQIFKTRGEYEMALKYLEQSLTICQQIGDKQGEGTTLNNISQIHSARGDYETELKYLEESLAICQQIGDKQGEGTTLNNMATTAHARGDYETALKYLEQSLAVCQQIGAKQGEGTTLNNISQIFKARGDYETALKYLEQSLAICQQIGDKQGEGTTLNNISQIHSARGDYKTALKYLEKALTIREQIGDINGLAVTLNNMGEMLYKQEQYLAAFPLLLQAYQIFRQIGSPNEKAPISFLNAIVGKVGEAQVQEWMAEMEQS